MYHILICYYGKYPTRTTILDHLYSFERYSGARCYYVDLAMGSLPRYLLQVPFDLIIFHTNFLSARWNVDMFHKIVNKARPLKDSPAVKVVIPQDEFYYTSVVCDFINEFNVQHVFSVSPPSEWGTIYRSVDFGKVQFHEVLTGYLEKSTLQRIEQAAQAVPRRDLEIGYRAWRAEPWLGRHGFLKTKLAEVFEMEFAQRGVKADISTRAEDTLHGDTWYKFLLRCKYTVGVEGGASILDWDGSARKRTNQYTAAHPQASYEEIEAACFPGLEGSLKLYAISPRHLEACATRTCQILIEGEYNGVLEAGKHYIELKRDFSNLDQIFAQMKDERSREEMVENAYRDIVASGKYHYASFVRQVMEAALGTQNTSQIRADGKDHWWVWEYTHLVNWFAWVKAAFRGIFLFPLYQKMVLGLPAPLASRVELMVRKVLYR